jgi:hypothetical protein
MKYMSCIFQYLTKLLMLFKLELPNRISKICEINIDQNYADQALRYRQIEYFYRPKWY